MSLFPEKIFGHTKEQGHLLRDIATNNIAHAYLFSGPEHIGKFTIAKWFAFELLRKEYEVHAEQKVLEQMERLIHPDFLCVDMLWVEEETDDWSEIARYSNIPQEHRAKAPAAKTNSISIDDVRAIVERVSVTGETKKLCCLIRNIERMQPAAMNAFLKILEEPPPRVIFILTTSSIRTLLPTIVSRTRVVQFFPLKISTMQKMITKPNEDTQFALHICQGAPGRFFSLLSDPDTLREQRQLHIHARQFWRTNSVLERLQWLMPLVEKKEGLNTVVQHLFLALREQEDPNLKIKGTHALTKLVEGLQTNVHKGLLFEKFCLE